MKGKSSNKDRFVIIMAGGRGERFWPVSREKTPKQLITLLGDSSFLQQAVDRVLPVVPIENIYVITNSVQAPQVRKQIPKLPKENVIAEPCGRDTCPAVRGMEKDGIPFTGFLYAGLMIDKEGNPKKIGRAHV